MLKLSALEFFFRTIPESFLCVFLAYIFYNKNIHKIPIITTSISFAIATYLIRLLPISYGVNTMISMIAFIVISVYVLKIPVNISAFTIFISVILISFCEWINAVVLTNIFKINEFINATLKFIYYIPSLIMFIAIVSIIYVFVKKIIRGLKDVFH